MSEFATPPHKKGSFNWAVWYAVNRSVRCTRMDEHGNERELAAAECQDGQGLSVIVKNGVSRLQDVTPADVSANDWKAHFENPHTNGTGAWAAWWCAHGRPCERDSDDGPRVMMMKGYFGHYFIVADDAKRFDGSHLSGANPMPEDFVATNWRLRDG